MISLKSNPERAAWIILSTAFSIFCLMAVLIPASLYWYATNASQELPVDLTSVRGIVLYGEQTSAPTISLTDGNTVEFTENLGAVTDNTSQAILTFADDSSVTLYGNTWIEMQEARQPRYGISSNPSHIALQVHQGRIRATAARDRDDLNFEISTPHATVQLGQGSFSVEVNDKETQVTTRFGQATVISDEEALTLQQGQRAVASANDSLSPPLPAAQNLLADSDFSLDFQEVWEVYTITPIESVTATATVNYFQNRPVLNLRSQGQDNIHSEVGVIQIVNKDVRDFQSLRVFAEVRLLEQSLPGGGQLGSEFPIMLHVAYRDAAGSDRDWFHGFYYEPPPPNYILYDQPDNSSERVARFVWYPYESVNLLTTLGPAKPIFIKSIRIYASGWLYDAMVANISLLAEE